MKRFLIKFKEISYGVAEVFAENEQDARRLVEEYDCNLMVDNSEIELFDVVSEENN